MDRLAVRVVFAILALLLAGPATVLWAMYAPLLLLSAPWVVAMAIEQSDLDSALALVAVLTAGLALGGFWVLAVAYVRGGRDLLATQWRRWWALAGLGVVLAVPAAIHWAWFGDFAEGPGSSAMAVGLFGLPVLVPMAWLYLCRWQARHSGLQPARGN